MRISSDAIVGIGERLSCRSVDDHPTRFFDQRAIRGLSIVNHDGVGCERGVVKCVPGMRVLSHLNVLAGLLEAVEIGSTRSDCDVIVGDSVKDAYWMVRDISIVEVGRIALWIERNIGRWIDPACVPHVLEPLERRIEGRLSAARESHDRDSVRVNQWMPGQHAKTAIQVENHVQSSELRLINDGACDSSTRKGVECKCGYVQRPKLPFP